MLRWAPWSTALWGALILADAVFTALTLWATRGTVNAVVAAVHGVVGMSLAARWFAIMAGVQVCSRLAGLLRPYVRERVRVQAGLAIQRESLEKACRLPVEAFDVESTYDVVRRVGEGADTRGPDLLAEALGLAQQVPSVLVNAVFLAEIALWLPFAAAAMEAVFIWQMIAQGRRQRAFDVDWTRRRRLTDYYATLLTTRQPAAEVRLWRLAGELLRRWKHGLMEYARAKHRLEVRETLQFLPSSVMGSVFVVVAVWAVVAFHGRVEPGLAALFLTAFFGVMAGMNAVQRSVRRFVGHAGYAADLRQLVEVLPAETGGAAATALAGPTVQGAPDADGPPLVAPPEPETPGSAAHQPALSFPRPLRAGFRLQGVRYRYPGASQDALRGVDAEVPADQIVALVDANGAGKSTLAALVLGLLTPAEGTVRLDGSSTEQTRSSAVFQDFVRYTLPVRDNVGFGALERLAADSELRVALRQSGSHLADGDLDAWLGPEFDGQDLSGGEWLRLAVARGAVANPGLIVMDEPTAAIDPLAEVDLVRRLLALGRVRTAIVVSHRLGIARAADRILVLDHGMLVEEGHHDDLLRAGRLYARMWRAQASWYTPLGEQGGDTVPAPADGP